MGTVPISVIMGFDYPLDASQVQLLLSVHQVIFLNNSIYVVNLDNKLLQQISTIIFFNNSDKFCLPKGYNMRLNWDREFSSTSFWHTIWSLLCCCHKYLMLVQVEGRGEGISYRDHSNNYATRYNTGTHVSLKTSQPWEAKFNNRRTPNIDTGKFLPTYWSTEGLL